jgi:mono/diheme cytochrome c family protein
MSRKLSVNAISRLLVAALAWPAMSSAVQAAPVDFVRQVRPIFVKHCYACHGEEKQKSGLRLDVKAAAFQGGDGYGPSIVAGKPDESPLYELVASDDSNERMPPERPPLSAAEIAVLRTWIAEGAIWPDGIDRAKLKDKRDHWAFKPLAVSNSSTAPGSHSIDDFIHAKLRENGLSMSPPAEPEALIRRLYFDLTGLPPTPEEVEEFVQAYGSPYPIIPSSHHRPDQEAQRLSGARGREQAYEALVDKLLASPRYGERWAQHWLDVVRYADTHGFEVNTERPSAWPYRDYVIRAFNDDVPYDRFVREQIVGDAFGADAATGFLVTASVLLPGQIGKDAPSIRLARQDALDEIVTNIGQTFLGLSVGCARCHDHKFDPVSAVDYYALQAFVAGVEYGDRNLETPEAVVARKEAIRTKARITEIDRLIAGFVPPVRSGVERPMINARHNVERFAPVAARRVRFTVRATNSLEPCLDELEVFNTAGENVALAAAGAKVSSSGDVVVADRHDLKYLNDGRYGNSRSWMSNEKGKGWVVVEFPATETIDRIEWGRDRPGNYSDRLATSYQIEAASGIADDEGDWKLLADETDRCKFDSQSKPPRFSTKGLSKDDDARADKLMTERSELERKQAAATEAGRVFAGTFRTPDEIRLLSRGDPEQPKEVVPPAVPAALGQLMGNALRLDAKSPEQDRRRALADWIADPKNPLTARVMVNRIWQGHFGAGLVRTPSDFGNNGLKPTHPELLDWLAAEFIRDGWSIKQMHRRIVMSQTYRQSSDLRGTKHQTRNTKHDFREADPSALDAAGIDKEIRLLWRYPSRRLEAESLRDTMLAVSGKLNPAMYGRGFDFFDKRGGLTGFTPVEQFTDTNLRRMIYAHKVRREPEAVFGAFDCPDGGQSAALRRVSTTPIQALNLFNSRFTLELSTAFAERVKREAGDDLRKQIDRAYRLALNRPPDADEFADAEAAVRDHGLPTLCRALFNCHEFLTIP